MKKTRLWLAAPALALSLLAVPMMEAEASQVTATNGGAIVTEVIETDRAVMNAGIKVKDAKEAAALIAKDLKQISATTTFTMEYKDGIDKFKKEVDAIFTEASGMDEYVYGMGAGYALNVSYSDTTYTATLSYNYHLLSKSFEKKDLGNGTYELVFHQELHADDVKSVQAKEKEITDYVKKEAARLFTKDMSDFEKVKAAYDFVIVNTTYGTTPKPGYGAGHSPYSIVKDGVGVCQAYALLFQRLMDEAGVESKYVVGERVVPGYTNKKEGHAWNVVTIDGKTYHIDTTHGDPVADHLSNEYISYETFLLTEEQIQARGHIITEERPYVKPTSTKYKDWHSMSDSKQIGNVLHYVDNFVLKKALITKDGQIQPQHSAQTINAYFFTKFNNKVYFTEFMTYRTQLKVMNEHGEIETVKTGYNKGYSEETNVWEIEVKNNELFVYEYADGGSTNVVYQEKLKKPVKPEPQPEPEPEKPTPEQVEETFAAGSPTVKAIEAAKTKAAFAELLKELEKFVNAQVVNEQLDRFKMKVEGYKKVAEDVAETTTWAKPVPKVADSKKQWSIEFNVAVHKDSEKQLYVTDIFGKKLEANVEAIGKIVTVTPIEEYVKGAEYYLIIPKDVESTTGEMIKEAISVPFTFE